MQVLALIISATAGLNVRDNRTKPIIAQYGPPDCWRQLVDTGVPPSIKQYTGTWSVGIQRGQSLIFCLDSGTEQFFHLLAHPLRLCLVFLLVHLLRLLVSHDYA
jgi:hypothetical protein